VTRLAGRTTLSRLLPSQPRTISYCAYFPSQLVSPRPIYPEGYSATGRTGRYDEDGEDDDEFHQQTLMRTQDEQLEGVSYTVGNLRQQAREMGDELEDQAM